MSHLIRKINVVRYRKLQNLEFSFSKKINVLSGTNGTCKTSLLHMVSNSFQAVTQKCDWTQDKSCLEVIKQVNSLVNPKIESLTKGDKTHNDPAMELKVPFSRWTIMDTHQLNLENTTPN